MGIYVAEIALSEPHEDCEAMVCTLGANNQKDAEKVAKDTVGSYGEITKVMPMTDWVREQTELENE